MTDQQRIDTIEKKMRRIDTIENMYRRMDTLGREAAT
jgi:hypothetical protein